MTPAFIHRLRERTRQREASAESEQITKLNRLNAKLMDDVTHYQNVNNRLWNALRELPGGLEAARKITV